MFNDTRYIPILRWKEAERLALRDLGDDIRSRITPLVQVVPESLATGKRTPSVGSFGYLPRSGPQTKSRFPF
jgi:hypothetical protein